MATHRTLIGSVALLVLAFLPLGEGLAQEALPVQATLALTNSVRTDKLVFRTDSVIGAAVELSNVAPEEVITFQGFKQSPFHLRLKFTDPDGKGITSELLGTFDKTKTHVPPPLTVAVEVSPGEIEYRQVEPVEVLPAGWTGGTAVFNLEAYYSYFAPPIRPGRYSVRATIPLRTYPQVDYIDPYNLTPSAELGSSNHAGDAVTPIVSFAVIADQDGDGYFAPESDVAGGLVDCDDGNAAVYPGAPPGPDGLPNDCDPSDPEDGEIDVRAEMHTVGTGSHPGSTKEPLEVYLYVYSKAPGSCAAGYGVSWQHYPDILGFCSAFMVGKTDPEGKTSLFVPAGDYLLIGEYDGILIGRSVGTVLLGQTVDTYLQIIAKADGKKIPGKYTIKTGSELMIIEPEYVEWSGTQELYPFIFQSLGDWSVSTSISPPEGFVADHESLDADVNTTLKAVQFTVTDVGSKWVDTKVVHTLKHKNRKEIVKSRIGVRKLKKGKKEK